MVRRLGEVAMNRSSSLGAVWILALSTLAAVNPSAVVCAREPEEKPRTIQPDRFTPDIPEVWDGEKLAGLEVPLANAKFSPRHVPAAYYYRIPVREIFRTYPVYHPDHEPKDYWAQLRQKEPVKIWDATRLKTKEDWIRAGEAVFEAPIGTGGLSPTEVTELYLRDRNWYTYTEAPRTRDGVLPFYRYVIREKGKVEIGMLSCAMCHTRVQDGVAIKGAQGNFPFERALAYGYRTSPSVDAARALERSLYAAPWVKPDPQAGLERMSARDLAALHETVPAGVLARHRASPYSPVQVPDLIGVAGRKYLDRSGLQLHRDIGDLMRYAALNQGGDDLASFGGFRPAAVFTGAFPEPTDPALGGRYSDEQLYALALYLYSLKPPANPNLPKSKPEVELVDRGRGVFTRLRCARCHSGEDYTNNKLTPADGFVVPNGHLDKYQILEESVGTDPELTLHTRRGTGYYKVPSLRGVWYRGPFEHSGSVATLEDWFDSRRLREDYEPTGWKGPPGTKKRAVPGHRFGLNLPPEERRALIAFLKTL
jgi:hypothetical protein